MTLQNNCSRAWNMHSGKGWSLDEKSFVCSLQLAQMQLSSNKKIDYNSWQSVQLDVSFYSLKANSSSSWKHDRYFASKGRQWNFKNAMIFECILYTWLDKVFYRKLMDSLHRLLIEIDRLKIENVKKFIKLKNSTQN